MNNHPLADSSEAIATRQAIRTAQSVLIVSHVRPDGDAIGSVVGLGLTLQKAGKQVQMVLADGVPSALRVLEGTDQIVKRPTFPVELSIAVDCSDLPRVGEIFPEGFRVDINIDHHATNDRFARINVIDEFAVSTTSMLAELLPAWGFTLTKAAASALLTGLITDTIGFRTPNMTPSAMRCAANMMEAGADLPELYYSVLTQRTYEEARLWGVGLSNLYREDDLLWTSITLAERQNVGYAGRDDADLVNLLPTIEGINIAIIFLEQADGHVKISWRSKDGYDISELAQKFGGGGHKNAAGASMMGEFDVVRESVLAATRTLLKNLTTLAVSS